MTRVQGLGFRGLSKLNKFGSTVEGSQCLGAFFFAVQGYRTSGPFRVWAFGVYS